MQEIDRLDDGEGERDEKKQHGSGHEADCRDGGVASVSPLMMGIIVLVVVIKVCTTAPAAKHGGVYVRVVGGGRGMPMRVAIEQQKD